MPGKNSKAASKANPKDVEDSEDDVLSEDEEVATKKNK